MPEVGDRIQLVATKVSQAPRIGVVTDVRGRMITVRWPSGEQSLVVPALGTLTVLGREGAAPRRPKVRSRASRSAKAARPVRVSTTRKRTAGKSSAEELPVKKAVAKKAVAKATTKLTAKKADRKAPVRKTAKSSIAPKRASAKKKAARKRVR